MAGATGSGRVAGLYVAARAGAPVEARREVVLVPGVGIPGDRYATRAGYWSDPKWPDQELTLVEAEVAEALGLDPGLLRRNVVTRGVRLHDLVGATFRLGEALVEGVRPCDPCRHLAELAGRPGLVRDLAGRGGLRARIVAEGRVRVGDAVDVVAGGG